MRLHLLGAAFFVGSACVPNGPDPFGGTDIGEVTDDAPFEDMSGDIDDDTGGFTTPGGEPVGATCDPETAGAENRLTATSTAEGIEVHHSGVDTWCDATWDYQVSVTTDRIEVLYVDQSGVDAESATCWCAWDLSYVIPEVPPGAYTLVAAGDETTVTVEAE